MSTENLRTLARLAVVMTDLPAVRVPPCVRHLARVMSDVSAVAVVLSLLRTSLTRVRMIRSAICCFGGGSVGEVRFDGPSDQSLDED
jgi:hypothetical protein